MIYHKNVLVAAALLGFCAVAFGAFGAHYLKTILSPEQLQWWEKGVQYQFYHLAPILFLAFWQAPQAKSIAFFFLLGCICFSGSLYLMALTNMRFLGAVTPVGGLFFLIGWARIVYEFLKKNAKNV